MKTTMSRGSTAHIRFEHIVLEPGTPLERTEPTHETVIVILGGECTVKAQGSALSLSRTDVFSGPASAVYVPAGTPMIVETDRGAELAWCAGIASPGGAVLRVGQESVRCRIVGRDSYERRVCDIIDDAFPAQHLLVGETFNEAGKWSSFPPHRHDEDRLPQEADMEEVYFFKVDPPEGFGLQRLYSPEAGFDRAVVLVNHSVVEIAQGYHPVSAAPGCKLYYLWILWGEKRTLAPFDDPALESVKRRLEADRSRESDRT
jgi:5-deoxy-glucuronate isomerase